MKGDKKDEQISEKDAIDSLKLTSLECQWTVRVKGYYMYVSVLVEISYCF